MRFRTKSKPILSLETSDVNEFPDDGLEVTKAIQVVQAKSHLEDPENVKMVLDEMKRQEEEESTEDQESGDNTDSLDGSDVNSDDVPNPEEMEDAAADATALESLIEAFEKTGEAPKQPYRLKSIDVTLESSNGFLATAKAALKAVWDKLVEYVVKIVDFVTTLIEINQSKLKLAKEEIIAVEEMVDKLTTTTPLTPTIENELMASLLTTSTNISGAASIPELISSITNVTAVASSYFDHLKMHYLPFATSIEQAFGNSVDNMAIDQSNSVKLVVGKMTLPSVLKRVNDIPGKRKLDPSLEAYMGPIMPKGTRLAAFTAPDNTLSGDPSHPNAVIHNKIFLVQDFDHNSDVSELQVGAPQKLKEFIVKLDDLRAKASQGEIHLMAYRRGVENLKKLILKQKKQTDILDSSSNEQELKDVIKSRRMVGTMINYALIISEYFYGRPNRSMMEFINAVLSAGIAYCNKSVTAYMQKPNPKDKAKP